MKGWITGLLLLIALQAWAQYKLYEEGIKRYNARDYYGAVERFSDFLTRQYRDRKFDPDAYYWRGMSAYNLKDYSEALDDFKQAAELNHPKAGNCRWLMAKCYENLNQLDNSIIQYGDALRMLSSDQQSKVQLLYDRSKVYSLLGNNEAAINDLRQALAIQPSNELIKMALTGLTSAKPDATGAEAQREIQDTGDIAKKTEQAKVETAKTDPPKTEPVKPEPKEEKVAQTVPQQQPVTQQVVPVVTAPREPTLAEIYKDEKRYALVIGNSTYPKQIGTLKNPVNDATDFANALRSMNFDVTLVTDASYGKIRVEMMKFREKLNQGDRDQTVGLFYYAGHGLQYEGENYLVPVDAEIQYEDDIPRFCYAIQKNVLSQMEMTNSRMNIVILDACRNNPFPSLTRSIGETAGLGEMKKARGAFIAYATAPGSVASDGAGKNGLYTQELIKAMNKPGRTIEQVFKEVRANVLRQSGDRQNPWENSNIIGDFYFKFQ
jgi:tetratricopeptide (TPR) repeat protein